ncbi:MAG: hypothetical protein K6C36_10405 [Clostridia bacterium]|nr:hypothetical protein [Clostridia bacterium]
MNKSFPMSLGVVSAVIIQTVYIHWCFSVRRRFPQKQMRLDITLFAAAFILLSVLRPIKYSFVVPGSTAARYIWYAYYIPLTFGPAFMLHASMFFGRPDGYRVSSKWYWYLLPPALISSGIMTNDLHRLAFRFDPWSGEWEAGYTYGPLYYIAAGWIVLNLLGVIALAVRSTFKRRNFRALWFPAAVLAVLGLYHFIYVYVGRFGFILQRAFVFNDFICVGSMALWESFVTAQVIVSNRDYPAIFSASSLNAGLADRDFTVRQVSSRGVSPSPEQLRAAAGGELLIENGELLLKARAVRGGWFYWTEDRTELNRMKEMLADTADYLEEENDMLRLTAQIEEERRKTSEKTKLYDRVTESISPQLDSLSVLLDDPAEDDAAFRGKMQTAGVLVAYIKRRGNLLLLADSQSFFSGEELGLCFEESVKALRRADVRCEYAYVPGFTIRAQDAILMYEAFEKAVERALPTLEELRLSLRCGRNGCAALELNALCCAPPPTEDELEALRRCFDNVVYSSEGCRHSLMLEAETAGTTREVTQCSP